MSISCKKSACHRNEFARRIALAIAWASIWIGNAVGQEAKKSAPPTASYPANSNYVAGPHGQYIDKATGKPVRVNGHPVDEGIIEGYLLKEFHPEQRDFFYQMDKVADANGELQSLDFDMHTEADRQAVYGRNTWILWCAGNEGFWNWLAQDGYGFLDFLHVIDSRKRHRRFQEFGLINQPGMISNPVPGPWGLYLDKVAEPLEPNPKHKDYEYEHPLYKRKYSSAQDGQNSSYALESDGVDPKVYGYPTGIVGMRLFPNPFFDERAQKRWNAESFYNDPNYARNPEIVRPFRVGVSCAFCHVAPHPLNPPDDPENPKWENLSSIIGNQYFRTSAITGSRAARGNFIWHVLAVAQPGTIDASLISTDHINNPNTMNGVFQVPARLARANLNPAEKQGAPAKLIPPNINMADVRHTPHVLLDGADSISAWGALARVYLNIGTFYEEWNECHNPVLGYTKQKPFSIETCQSNSFYWKVNEEYRVNALVAFFTWQKKDDARKPLQTATAPMKLQHVQDLSEKQKKDYLPDDSQVKKGRDVFAKNCFICHSSKQPNGFDVTFAAAPSSGSWEKQTANAPHTLELPMLWINWSQFQKSPAYQSYIKAAQLEAEKSDFLEENFLSTDIRIPVSLVGTNAGRPLGRNALKDWVWSDFSSTTYKELPAVGKINYFDPFSGKDDQFQPPGNGPGYLRPATLVSIWATAPLLHNNALGKYIPDHQYDYRVSTKGRLEMFDDAIKKLLWNSKRAATPSGEGGLRGTADSGWHGADQGWVFRTDIETSIILPKGHLRQAVDRTLPAWVVWFIDHPYLIPGVLLLLFIFAKWRGYRWLVFSSCIILGLILFGVLVISGLQHIAPWWVWFLVFGLPVTGIAAVAGGKLVDGNNSQHPRLNDASPKQRAYEWLLASGPKIARISAVIILSVFLFSLWQAGALLKAKIDGQLGDLVVGPIPKGVPVNSLINFDPEASITKQLAAMRGLLSAISEISKLPRDAQYEDKALQTFNAEAGKALLEVSSCRDMVLDHGHLFGESLPDDDKHALIAFLKTL